MAGNTFGRLFSVTTWGESHGTALGAVIDGCPPAIPLSPADIQKDMDRRRPGRALTSPRAETDTVEILSGVFEGLTTGTPISLIIYNRDVRSSDYSRNFQALPARSRRQDIRTEIRFKGLAGRRQEFGP